MAELSVQDIQGYKEVVAWYGKWPSFHDAEVVSIVLHRSETSEVIVHAFEMTSEITESGHYKCIKHARVIIHLDTIETVEVLEFNHQNVIDDMSIEHNGVAYVVKLFPIYGSSATFIAKKLWLSLEVGLPANSVYSKSS